MKNFITCIMIAPVVLAGSCGSQNNASVSEESSGSRTAYSLSFFRNTVELSADDDNITVSPYSAGVALSMLAEGAEGETLEELLTALGGGSFGGGSYSADSIVDIRSANSAWISQLFRVKQSYVSALKTSYDAEVQTRDFSDPSTPDAINSWCYGNTEGRIPEIVDNISSDMMMFLVNALYFKAPWETPFDESRTKNLTFHGSAGDRTTPMMYVKGRFEFVDFAGNQMIRLPYEGGPYSMLIGMPAKGMDINSLTHFLTENLYNLALSTMSYTEVELTLPKFSFETDMILNSILAKMGVQKVFSRGAELGGISNSEICVDQVRQKCFIEVNEEGSEAAAVTSIGLRLTSAPVATRAKVMTVDRPFVYAIVDELSGEILFMGRVMNLGS